MYSLDNRMLRMSTDDDLRFPNRPVQYRVMDMLGYVLMCLVHLELAVLGSLDRHDTKEENKMTL